MIDPNTGMMTMKKRKMKILNKIKLKNRNKVHKKKLILKVINKLQLINEERLSYEDQSQINDRRTKGK